MVDLIRRLVSRLMQTAGVELRERRRGPLEDAAAAAEESRAVIAAERKRSDAVGRHLRAYDRAVRSSRART